MTAVLPSFAAAEAIEEAEGLAREEAHDSWAPVDLGPYLRGEIVRPAPTVGVTRSDGLRLLYPGKEHSVIGEMESGKSWFALACVAAELGDNHQVVYMHFEEADPSDTVERLLALGCADWEILKLFRFVGPDRQVSADALGKLLDPAPSLVIFDGVNEAMSLHRWDIRDESGAAEFRRCLVKPCTRVGAATLAADHVVKDAERRGRTALGSVHKVNGLSGALFLLENAEPFGRDQRGRSHVYVMKDRPGYLRRTGTPVPKVTGRTFMGELVVDDTQTRGPDLYLNFWAPKRDSTAETAATPDDPNAEVDAQVLKTIKAIIGKGEEANLRAVRGNAGIGKDKVDDAIERLKFTGTLAEAAGPNRKRIFTVSVAEDQSSESAA